MLILFQYKAWLARFNPWNNNTPHSNSKSSVYEFNLSFSNIKSSNVTYLGSQRVHFDTNRRDIVPKMVINCSRSVSACFSSPRLWHRCRSWYPDDLIKFVECVGWKMPNFLFWVRKEKFWYSEMKAYDEEVRNHSIETVVVMLVYKQRCSYHWRKFFFFHYQ